MSNKLGTVYLLSKKGLRHSTQWYDFSNMLHRNGMKIGDFTIFKFWDRAMIFIWVTDMGMVWYGKPLVYFYGALLESYKVFYIFGSKKWIKKKMSRNLSNSLFLVESVLFNV